VPPLLALELFAFAVFFGAVEDLELLVLFVLADVPVVVAEREAVSSL
jgi:hypothetical protein